MNATWPQAGVVLCLLLPAQAAAQQVPPSQAPASPAVFGGARRPAPDRRSSLTASAQLLGGYDDNVSAQGLGGDPFGLSGAAQPGSTFAGAGLGLTFQQRRPRVAYTGGVQGEYRSFFGLQNLDLGSYDGNVAVDWNLSPRSSLGVNGLVGVQPFYQFNLVGGLQPAAPMEALPGPALFGPRLQVATEQVMRYGVGANYGYSFGPRTSFHAQANRTGFEPLNDAADLSALSGIGGSGAGAGIRHQLRRNLGLRLGYAYRSFDATTSLRPVSPPGDASGPAGPVVVSRTLDAHDLDVGFDYSRELPFARRTYFASSTGASIIRGAPEAQTDSPVSSRVHLNAHVSLRRDFLRTWTTSAGFGRGTSYVEGLNQPVVTDSASFSVAGLLTDRLDANVAVRYTDGSVILGRTDEFQALDGGTSLRYAFNTNVAAFVSYNYSRSGFSNRSAELSVVLPPRLERQTVSGGLTVWLDLLR